MWYIYIYVWERGGGSVETKSKPAWHLCLVFWQLVMQHLCHDVGYSTHSLRGPPPKLYLLCRVKSIAWCLRHPNRRMLTGPRIFVPTAWVSISVASTIKRPCAIFWHGEMSDKYQVLLRLLMSGRFGERNWINIYQLYTLLYKTYMSIGVSNHYAHVYIFL